jgi:hypothetical protein
MSKRSLFFSFQFHLLCISPSPSHSASTTERPTHNADIGLIIRNRQHTDNRAFENKDEGVPVGMCARMPSQFTDELASRNKKEYDDEADGAHGRGR